MNYQVCRPLTASEYAELKADIAENGVLVPIEVDEHGDILDGHHRLRAWQELSDEGFDVPPWAKLVRQGLTEEQKRNHARKLNVLRRQMSKDEREQIMVDMRRDGMSYRAIANAVGVDPKTAYNKTSTVEISTVKSLDGKERPAIMSPKPTPPISLFVPGNEALDADAAEATVKVVRQERREEIRSERVERINEIAKGNAPLAMPQRYPVIYADPPWRYEHSRTVSREIENQYPTMSLEEICALPVIDLAADDAVLFLWTTSPKLAESLAVIDCWGFTYRTCMVWDKERMGMGYYARQQHELLLICTRGELPVPEPSSRPRSVVRIPRDPEHSTKPQEFYALIEGMYPEYEKIELFARSAHLGWNTWGNQIVVRRAVSTAAIIDVSKEIERT